MFTLWRDVTPADQYAAAGPWLRAKNSPAAWWFATQRSQLLTVDKEVHVNKVFCTKFGVFADIMLWICQAVGVNVDYFDCRLYQSVLEEENQWQSVTQACAAVTTKVWTMGFFLQLRILLWKNLTLKRRSPVNLHLIYVIVSQNMGRL